MKKILIVDDQPDITDIIKDFIEGRHPEVKTITLNDPLEALGFIQKNSIDLLISDHHMPNMSGSELLKKIRLGTGNNKNVPVVFLTAMKKEIDNEIQDYNENVVTFNKLDKIHLIVDEIEKYLA